MTAATDQPATAPPPRPALPALLVPAWLLLLGAGFWVLERYRNTPGEAGPTARRWPAASTLPPPRSRPSLLLFAHPRCPCPAATLAALRQILAEHGRDAAVCL